MNTVNLIGRLAFNPDIKRTKTGMAIVNLRLVVHERVKQGNDWVDKPIFIDVTCFGDRYEKLAPFLPKGNQIGVSGKLDYSTWETETGEKRSKVSVIAHNVTLISTPTTNQASGDPLKDHFGGETIRKTNQQNDDEEFPF